jgi:serine/threonine-protein kinase
MSLQRRITRPSFMLDLVEGSPVGEYEIQTQIGEGAMGTVYSAVHPLIGKKVAIKVLKPELCANQGSIDRFVQEAQAINQIGHPNIVDVFMLSELPDGRAFFVMEWLQGEDLKARLARGPMTVADTCDILDGIARALDAAHAKGIVHRDLKPDNVFLHQVDNGPLMVKLLDFGIAKLVRVTPGQEKTQTGNMLGTPRYISPEQARGIQVDHRSDIYSLGVMAYEMLAGRPPFQGESAMDLVVKHLGEPPPPLSQFTKVPKSLEQCVMRMLEKDPSRRPTLEEVRGILVDPSRRLTPLPSRTSAYNLTPLAQPPARRRWPIYVLAGVAALGLGVLTWKLVGGNGDAREQGATAVAPVAPPQRAEVATPPPPAPPVPATPAPATLDIHVSGSKDAVILVDGKEWGRGSTVKVEVPPGDHEVVVRAPGRAPQAQHVTLAAGQVNTVSMVVPALPVHVPVVKTHPGKTTPAVHNDDDLLAPKKTK